MTLAICHPLQDAENALEFGGKAAHLARVHRLGCRVPETRVLGREALRRFLAANELEEPIAAYLQNPDRSEAVFESIAAAVARATVPAELRAEIRTVAEELLQVSPCGLAVRSSAVCEDSERASFAGVFESYVGALTPDEVIEKVVACWRAGWAPRALRYMDRMGLEPFADGMAVMVQEVVSAVSSGVITTADPESGDPWRFVLDATRGLPIDLLSGSGVGDSFRVDWESGAVLEREIVAKPSVTRATPEGVVDVAVEAPASTEPAVSDEEISEVARIARELDERLDARLDIEWAITPEGVWVLQARPLTALPAFFPVELTPEQERRSWKPALVTLPLRADQPPHLLTPLYRHYSEAEMWHRYQPADIVLTSIWRHELDVNGYRYCETDPQPTFQDFFEGPGEYEVWIGENERRYRQRWDRRGDELRAIRDAATRGIAETTSAAELIPVLLDVMDRLWDLNAFGWSGPQALGWMCEGALDHLLGEHLLGDRADTAVLLGGGSDSYTFRVSKAQQALGREIRETVVVEAFEGLPLDRVVPHLREAAPDCDFLARFESFCWEFGKTPPSWLDRPSFWSADAVDVQIVSAVKNAWRGKSRDVEAMQARSRAQRQQQEREIHAALGEAGSDAPERFDRLLEWARYWGQALNDRHGLTVGLLHERELVWQVGCRLVREGLFERVEDVLVLERRDLESIARDGVTQAAREVCRERLWDFRRHRRLTPVDALGADPPGEETAEAPPAQTEEVATDEGGFQGRGFGGGAATGRARKVEDLSDATVLESLGEDDVLVLPHETAFHYADWHSLLTVVKAVVSPGRPSHHLARVARECAVPLVGHVTGDLEAIPEGAEIRVDGSSGRVEVVG